MNKLYYNTYPENLDWMIINENLFLVKLYYDYWSEHKETIIEEVNQYIQNEDFFILEYI